MFACHVYPVTVKKKGCVCIHKPHTNARRICTCYMAQMHMQFMHVCMYSQANTHTHHSQTQTLYMCKLHVIMRHTSMRLKSLYIHIFVYFYIYIFSIFTDTMDAADAIYLYYV